MRIKLGQPYSFCQMGLRTNQEDARFPDDDKPINPKPFFVVCDGVGGCDAGEVASKTVCKSIGRELNGFDWDEDFSNLDFAKVLAKAYKALDRMADNDNKEMATTMSFAAFHGGGCTLAHIGDSRIYQIRPSAGILYRSEDHSLVDSLVHNGLLSPDASHKHPQATTVTRYMCPVQDGEERFAATVLRTTDIERGDYFLICSDGVLDRIDDELLVEIVCNEETDEQKVRTLASLSQESQDNNTAFLIPILSVTGISYIHDSEKDESQFDITQRTSGSKSILQDVDVAEESFKEKFFNMIDYIFN